MTSYPHKPLWPLMLILALYVGASSLALFAPWPVLLLFVPWGIGAVFMVGAIVERVRYNRIAVQLRGHGL